MTAAPAGLVGGGTQGSAPAPPGAPAAGDAPDLRRLVRLRLCQWFLTELSLRPGSSFAMSHHRLPTCCHAVSSMASSSSVHLS